MDFKEQLIGAWKGILIVVGVVGIVGLIVSFRYDPELAKFVAYLTGGGLLLWQVMASSQRANAADETAKAMQKTADSTEKGNIAERFKNAIEHLGHESPSVRLGGIYALHHIAQDEKEYRERILEILCGHIRDTTTQDGYKPRMIQIGEENSEMFSQPNIEIQSILKLLFIDSPGCDIYTEFTANLEHSELKATTLGNTNLQHAVFLKANLQGANFEGAGLQSACFAYAYLNSALFISVKLQGANFGGAVLQDANFRNANLNSTTFYGAELQRAILDETDLQDANFHNAKFNSATFVSAKLQRANFGEANLQSAYFLNANLYRAIFNKAVLRKSHFERANLQDANFIGAKLQDTYFEEVDLQNADFEGADLQNANLQGADLTGANNLTTEQLLTAKTLYQAKLPDEIEAEIKQRKPELLEEPKPDNEQET